MRARRAERFGVRPLFWVTGLQRGQTRSGGERPQSQLSLLDATDYWPPSQLARGVRLNRSRLSSISTFGLSPHVELHVDFTFLVGGGGGVFCVREHGLSSNISARASSNCLCIY